MAVYFVFGIKKPLKANVLSYHKLNQCFNGNLNDFLVFYEVCIVYLYIIVLLVDKPKFAGNGRLFHL